MNKLDEIKNVLERIADALEKIADALTENEDARLKLTKSIYHYYIRKLKEQGDENLEED